MRALALRAALLSAALMCPTPFASTAVFAQSKRVAAQTAKPVIELAPSAVPDIYRIQPRAGEASFANPPANFHAFASARAGEIADVEQLTLKFNASTQLTQIESTKDFFVDPASGCQEGNRYSAGDSCILLMRFTPQGAGRRLGKLTISHTASPQPLSIGLGGNSYAPVISFTPAIITTVSGTYPSSKGLLSGANNLTVDGGDILYIADIGNDYIREIDSSGSITNIETYPAPYSLGVDNFGYIWILSAPGSFFYFGFYIPGYGEINSAGSYSPGTCTASSPCILNTVGLGNAGSLSIDPYDNLFMEEETYGAAELPVAGIANGGSSYPDVNIWYLRDSYAPGTGTPTAFATDADDNLYTFFNNGTADCEIVAESAYGAESYPVVYNRAAGADNCGFSGDGGQARDAEIGSSVGQIFFDLAGNLYFSDTANQRVRRIDYTTGQINTIAGNGTAGYTGDNSQATSAELSSPTGVAVDSQGQVYIISSASSGQVVRKLGPNGFLSFGNQSENTSSAAHLVTVANSGNSTMTLTRAYIGGTNAADFAIDPNTTSCNLTAGMTLIAGQSCKVGVIFTPGATGSDTASLIFLDNTVTGSNTVQLAGTGTSGALTTPTFVITSPASNASVTSGTVFNFTVKVSSTSGPVPTGTATMLLDGTAITGSPAKLNSSGVAVLSVSSTTLGGHTLSATYNGDSNYATAGPITRTFTIASGTSKSATVAVKSSANPASTCSPVSLAVTVTGAGTEKPTGMVKLMRGTEFLGEAALDNGAATVKPANLKVGTNELTARYLGDSTHDPAASEPFNQVVSSGAECVSGLAPYQPTPIPVEAPSR